MTATCSGCPTTWTDKRFAHCGSCHRTFASVALFDTHRSSAGVHGACLDPETIVSRDTGARLLFHRNGAWRGLEMSPAARAKLRALKDTA